MEYNSKFDTATPLLKNYGRFQRLVGKLIYLTITRPDITYAMSFVSQFMQTPTEGSMELVHRILRYLKSCPSRGILMENNGHSNIDAFSDADWAGCPFDRRSRIGFCTFVGGNLVTWKSKKQNVVARSSAEAEYRAMASTTSELVWLQLLLSELGLKNNSPMRLFGDNQAARHIASNPVFHERTKHIEVDCNFIREKVQNRTIQTVYVQSEKQFADVFTKALSKGSFQNMVSKLTYAGIFAPTWRGIVNEIKGKIDSINCPKIKTNLLYDYGNCNLPKKWNLYLVNQIMCPQLYEESNDPSQKHQV
ncbi:hypothetical protein CFOL_v3_25752 [Cephalotus follicularis]|uniref:Copia protein n=1 Tax=Cephalotus follicularis TaxID=3775 RepID=A0A1Q3CPW7_CEPFO|nr:hypothetical protein CFOL_v3_25752 [Cephalotus follicularis]